MTPHTPDLVLVKHHGLGNDFVVTVTTRADAPHRDDTEFGATARRITSAHRRGADGWLIATSTDGDHPPRHRDDGVTTLTVHARERNGIRCPCTHHPPQRVAA